MTKTKVNVMVASALLMLVAGCGSDTEGTGNSAGSGSESSSPPRADGRELADWAVVTFLDKKSTAICPVGTESLAKRFGKEGWCESDNDFKQTPVSLTVLGTCDTRKRNAPVAPGDLYLYVVDPSVQFTSEDGTDNSIIVTVNDEDGKWSVTDLHTSSTDPDDPIAGACAGAGLTPLDEPVSLGG